MRKGKREKVIKSKRWGSEWTREQQRRKGVPRPHAGYTKMQPTLPDIPANWSNCSSLNTWAYCVWPGDINLSLTYDVVSLAGRHQPTRPSTTSTDWTRSRQRSHEWYSTVCRSTSRSWIPVSCQSTVLPHCRCLVPSGTCSPTHSWNQPSTQRHANWTTKTCKCQCCPLTLAHVTWASQTPLSSLYSSYISSATSNI